MQTFSTTEFELIVKKQFCKSHIDRTHFSWLKDLDSSRYEDADLYLLFDSI